jgi:chemotaxis receptor (MCP) glutamine deamidase CheD
MDRLRARIFGGGRLLNLASPDGLNSTPLGIRNVEVATELLRKNRIPIDLSNVGGVRGKRITFHTNTGETTVKEL